MAFQQITDSEIQSGAPVDVGLLIKVKNNDSSLNATDISILQQIADILNKTDDALVAETKYLIDTIAPRGFIPANGVSIGKTTGTYSGSDYFLLYQKLWPKSLTTAGQPYVISAAKGATADADWNAGKTITIDESGLFTRAYKSGTSGAVGAKQSNTFQDHGHSYTDPGHTHQFGTGSASEAGIFGGRYYSNTTATSGKYVSNATTAITINGANSGSPSTETKPDNVAKYVFIRYSNKLIP